MAQRQRHLAWSRRWRLNDYLFAVLAVSLATIIVWWMDGLWDADAYASLLLCAVIFTVRNGGVGSGLLAISLSLLSFALTPTVNSSFQVDIQHLPQLFFFSLPACLIVWSSTEQIRTAKSLKLARDKLQTVCNELQLTNKALHAENLQRRDIERTLKEKETLYRSLFHSTFEAIFLHIKGEIIDVNPAFEEVFGYTRDEAIGMSIFDLTVAEDRIFTQQNLESGYQGKFQRQALRKDGTTFFGEGTVTQIEYQGQPVRVVAIQDLTQHLQVIEAERERRKIEQAMLASSRAVSSTLDLDSVLDAVLENVEHVVGHTSADVMIVDGDTIHIARARGPQAEDVQETLRFSLQEIANLRQVVETRKPLIVSDTHTDPNWVFIPQATWIRSNLSVPIVVGDKVIAILNVTSSQPHAFSERAAEVLEYFASNIGFALHNARLYEAERQARERAEALIEVNQVLSTTLSLEEVLDKILQQCAKVLKYSRGTIIAFTDGNNPVVAAAGFAELSRELVNHLNFAFRNSRRYQIILDTQRPLVIPDIRDFEDSVGVPDSEHIRSWMGVPLIVQGLAVGVLLLARGEVDAFNAADVQMAQAFADQAAIAIHNALLYQKENRERIVALTLQETAKALASSLQLDATLKLIMDLLAEVIEYDSVAVSLIEGEFIRLIASRGIPDDVVAVVSQPYHLPDIPLMNSLLQGESIMLADAASDPRWHNPAPSHSTPRGWIAVPMMAFGQTLGILSIGSNRPDIYSQHDLDAVVAFASQAAIAIQNSKLLFDLEKSLHDLRKAQIQIVRSARLSAAGEIAAGVAHQINNPLTAIVAHVHVLMQQSAPADRQYPSLAAIQGAAMHAGQVVQRLMDFGRATPKVMVPIDLNASITSAVELVRAQIEPDIARVTLGLAENLPRIVGSDEHLQDVWINLLLNARDAFQAGSENRIRVITRHIPQESAVEAIFEDNGAGIPSDKIPQIMEPFYTTKDYGTGLGLSIAQDVIKTHSGTLHIESSEGIGTRVEIRFPVRQGRSAIVPAHEG